MRNFREGVSYDIVVGTRVVGSIGIGVIGKGVRNEGNWLIKACVRLVWGRD